MHAPIKAFVLLTSLSFRLNLLGNIKHFYYPHVTDPVVVNQLSTCSSFYLCSYWLSVSSHYNYSRHGQITSLFHQSALLLPRVILIRVTTDVRNGVLQTSGIQAKHARLQQPKGKAPAMTAAHWAPTGQEGFARGFVKTSCLTIPIVANVVNMYAVLRTPPIVGGILHDIALATQGSFYTDAWNIV